MPAPQAQATNTSLPPQLIQEIAGAGTLAPSGDNLQPWRFRMDGESLLVIDDRSKDQSLFNVQNLASYIALGALLENMIVAASRYNYRADTCYFPNPQERDLIARVSFSPSTEKDPLADSIERRCTNRKPYERRPLDKTILDKLDLDQSRFSKLNLSWLCDRNDLKKLGVIVARADRLLFENPAIHKHLFSTIRWSAAEVAATRDGLPIETLELGAVGSKAFRLLKKWTLVAGFNKFGFSRLAAQHSALLMRRCSAAGLITASDTTPTTFIHVGQAFQRVWLKATKENLALQPMTALIFLQLRSRLHEYVGLTSKQAEIISYLRRELCAFLHLSEDSIPAMLFRLGVAPNPSARTVRRIISETSLH